MIIVVTSSPRYATHNEYVKCFGEHHEVYICPFDDKQRDLYLNKSVKLFNKLANIETFENV